MAQARAHDLLRGLRWAHGAGLPTHFTTLTHADSLRPTVIDFNARCKRRKQSLHRAGFGWEFTFWSLGADPPFPHRHEVTIGGRFIPKDVQVEHARRSQLGHIDVQWITRSERSRCALSNYVAVNGMNFALTMTASGAKRVQPFSPSTTWRTS